MTPYKTPESPLNRSRSSSCSSPVRNRVVYHEIFSLGANTLVRSYSCDQVFDKDSSGRTFQTTQIQVASFITPEKSVGRRIVKSETQEPRKLALEFPPMKPESSKPKSKLVKRFGVFLTVLKRLSVLSFLTATSACALYFYLAYNECTLVWNLEKIETELEENVFGQNRAISNVYSVLKSCNSSRGLHVMVFIGGVGVGKTYSSSIIRRNFPWSSNKHLTYSEYFTADVEKLLNEKLSVCGVNLVIIDDLSVSKAGEAVNLIALLNGRRKKNENLLVILIFQAPTEREGNEIISEFKNSYFSVNFILFKPLAREVVEKCFNAEIQRQGVSISEEELARLVEDKMKHIDVVKGPAGCKGVTEEVASFH